MNLSPISVYIHIPFCVRKCPYCAFSSQTFSYGDDERYIEALKLEIEQLSHLIRLRQINTLYIGGGTPSLLSLNTWNRLFTILENSFSFNTNAEVTVEANPVSLSSNQIKCWGEWRVNRVSIGIQSTDDAELLLLNRPHNARQGADALIACKVAGFSVSADLMFGLPWATFKNWARTLRDICALAPHHISIYQLTIEENTDWGKNPPTHCADGYFPYRFAQKYLIKKGYYQYEIASFARKGHESCHNQCYWADEDYLGLGASAWGYINGQRYGNEKNPWTYEKKLKLGKSCIATEEKLDFRSRYREAAILALRTSKGINWPQFIKKYGVAAMQEIKEKLMHYYPKWVKGDENNTSLTAAGFCIANQIWSELI